MEPKTPTNPLPPPMLADSWLDGFCESAAAAIAVKRTQDELRAAGITEAQIRAIRDELQEVFERWRSENPERFKEQPPIRGLLGDFFPTPESHPFDDYPTLLWKLHGVKYPPLTAISQKHDAVLPAALLLAEAAAGRFESARRVREEMDWVLLEIERDQTKALTHVLNQLLPAAEIGWKVRGAAKKRLAHEDKVQFQRLAKPRIHLLASVRDLDEYGEFAFFRMTYKPRTLTAWLRELGARLSPGRPRKTAAK